VQALLALPVRCEIAASGRPPEAIAADNFNDEFNEEHLEEKHDDTDLPSAAKIDLTSF
jgi:hypothetical protein